MCYLLESKDTSNDLKCVVCCVKAKFHYASCFGAGSELVRIEAGSKPNSITLSGSNQLRTSFEPASVMEVGFYKPIDNSKLIIQSCRGSSINSLSCATFSTKATAQDVVTVCLCLIEIFMLCKVVLTVWLSHKVCRV